MPNTSYRAKDGTTKTFFDKFSDRILPEPNSGCWFWMGETTVGGYGRVSYRARMTMAHRVAYMMDVGPIPMNLELDHLCRVRCCCNPDHLEPVTRAENIARSFGGTIREGHCIHGHKLSEELNFVSRRGHVMCRKCWRQSKKRFYYKGRAA